MKLFFKPNSTDSHGFFRIVVLLAVLVAPRQAAMGQGSEWIVKEGLAFVEDAKSFSTAVGIAFLNEPGKRPEDVKYLVSELRGPIVAVRNDGSIVEIGVDDSIHKPARELPHFDGETGQTGLCLSPDDQYLFSTGVERRGWARINKITKWRQVPGSNWTKIEKVEELVAPFENDPTSNAHQIGHCFVGDQGKLWVGIGDGHNHETSHDPKHSNGKLMRMNLDFTGVSDNPFYDPTNPRAVQSLVFALGLRNPFAVAQVTGETVYVADNGPSVDRLLEIEKGKNYPWNNTDESMTYNNLMTFKKVAGPSDMIYIPEDDPQYPSLRGHLLVAASHRASLIAIPVRPKVGVLGDPWIVVEPTNKEKKQDFTGLERGPDGIYVAHIRMNTDGGGILPAATLKLVPSDDAPVVAARTGDALFEGSGCRGCHRLAGAGSDMGPALDGLVDRLRERLNDEAYLAGLQALVDGPSHPDQDVLKPVRQQLIEREGTIDERVRLWIETKLNHPTIDNTEAAMAKLELPAETIEILTDFLVKTTDSVKLYGGMSKWQHQLRFQMEQNPRIPIFLTLLIGILLGVFFRSVVKGVRVLWRLIVRKASSSTSSSASTREAEV